MYVEMFCTVFSSVVLHKIVLRMRSTHISLTQFFSFFFFLILLCATKSITLEQIAIRQSSNSRFRLTLVQLWIRCVCAIVHRIEFLHTVNGLLAFLIVLWYDDILTTRPHFHVCYVIFLGCISFCDLDTFSYYCILT